MKSQLSYRKFSSVDGNLPRIKPPPWSNVYSVVNPSGLLGSHPSIWTTLNDHPSSSTLQGPTEASVAIFSFHLFLRLSLSWGGVSQSTLQKKTVYKYSSHCLFARESVLKHDMDKQSLFYLSLYWTYYVLYTRLCIPYMKYTTKSHSLMKLNISII